MPERFAPGLVSTDALELNAVFSPGGAEFFFARFIAGTPVIHRVRQTSGTWGTPQPLNLFPSPVAAVAVDMALSPDGTELFFLGKYPHPGSGPKPGADIWVSRKQNESWSPAELVPAPISTAAQELYPVVVADGSLYFSSSRSGGHGPTDLYRSQRLDDGRFAAPVNVGIPLNSTHGTGDSFVAPDESYVIFASTRPGGSGQGDLHISVRTVTGGWSLPKNLGDGINSENHEFCPMVTPDGRYLFFTRREGPSWADSTRSDVFWVDASVLDQYRTGR